MRPNLYMRMISETERQDLNPRQLRLIGDQENEFVDGSEQLGRDGYLSVFMAGVSECSRLRSLRLCGNGLVGVQQVCQYLPVSIEWLDLSRNHINNLEGL